MNKKPFLAALCNHDWKVLAKDFESCKLLDKVLILAEEFLNESCKINSLESVGWVIIFGPPIPRVLLVKPDGCWCMHVAMKHEGKHF